MIQTIRYDDPEGPEKLVDAFHDIGFVIIDSPPLDFKLQRRCYQMWEDFFANPDEAYAFDDETGQGWMCFDKSETAKGCDVADLKEFFHYYPDGICPEKLREVSQMLYDQMYPMASTLLSWLDMASPKEVKERFSIPLADMLTTKTTVMRMLHYPPIGSNAKAGAIRAAAHEDINLLTLLPAATADGLEVLTKLGQWESIKLMPNQCVVNIGDMLQEASGFYYRSTTHRVVNPVDSLASQSRYSVPLFCHPDDAVVLSGRYTAASYRKERFLEIGLLQKEND